MTPHPQPVYTMTLLALSGSVQEGSISTGLLKAAWALCPRDIQIDQTTRLPKLPVFVEPTEQDGEQVPVFVRLVREEVARADGLLIASPYGRGVPRMLTNALQWLRSSGVLRNKPVAVLNHTPQAVKAHTALCAAVQAAGAILIDDPALTIPLTPPGQRVTDILVEPATSALVERAVIVVVEAIRRLRAASPQAED